MILAVFLALLTHVSYALNDFSGALAARKIDGKLMVLLSWSIGTFLYSIAAPFYFRPVFQLAPLLATAGLGLLWAIAYPLFMTSAKFGNPTLSGVIAGTFPLWSVAFSVVAYHDRLTTSQAMIIAIIISGILLSALHLTKKTKFTNLFNKYSLLALLVSLMWGIGFGAWKYPIDKMGTFNTMYINNIFATLFTFILFYRPYKGKLFSKLRSHYKLPSLNAITGVVGTLAYSSALKLGKVSLIIPIAGSYGGLYAVLSYLKFKESLTKLQIIGLILILTGVVTLAVSIS